MLGPTNGTFGLHGELSIIILVLYALSGPRFKILCIRLLRKSQVERTAAEEAEKVKKPPERCELVGVLGWELLEAEGTVREKQREPLLSEKEQEMSGLVNAIVGVFHKG